MAARTAVTIETLLVAGIRADRRTTERAELPLGRFGRPEESLRPLLSRPVHRQGAVRRSAARVRPGDVTHSRNVRLGSSTERARDARGMRSDDGHGHLDAWTPGRRSWPSPERGGSWRTSPMRRFATAVVGYGSRPRSRAG